MAKRGKTTQLRYGNKFYELDPDKIMLAAEHAAQCQQLTRSEEKDFITVTVKPDVTIPICLTAPPDFARGAIALRNVRIITNGQREKSSNTERSLSGTAALLPLDQLI